MEQANERHACHRSGMARICGLIPLQGLQSAGHDRGQSERGHQVGHRPSRSGVEVAVDQDGRGVAYRLTLPGHRRGPD